MSFRELKQYLILNSPVFDLWVGEASVVSAYFHLWSCYRQYIWVYGLMKVKIFSNTVKFYPSGSTDENHIGKCQK